MPQPRPCQLVCFCRAMVPSWLQIVSTAVPLLHCSVADALIITSCMNSSPPTGVPSQPVVQPSTPHCRSQQPCSAVHCTVPVQNCQLRPALPRPPALCAALCARPSQHCTAQHPLTALLTNPQHSTLVILPQATVPMTALLQRTAVSPAPQSPSAPHSTAQSLLSHCPQSRCPLLPNHSKSQHTLCRHTPCALRALRSSSCCASLAGIHQRPHCTA